MERIYVGTDEGAHKKIENIEKKGNQGITETLSVSKERNDSLSTVHEGVVAKVIKSRAICFVAPNDGDVHIPMRTFGEEFKEGDSIKYFKTERGIAIWAEDKNITSKYNEKFFKALLLDFVREATVTKVDMGRGICSLEGKGLPMQTFGEEFKEGDIVKYVETERGGMIPLQRVLDLSKGRSGIEIIKGLKKKENQ